MEKRLTKRLALCLLVVTSMLTSARAQIVLLQDYANKFSPTIGTFQGIKFREGGFSGIYAIPGTSGKEFWVLSDRGMNVDGANANPSTCKPSYDKIFGFPNYSPKIFRIRLVGDSVQILRVVPIKRPGGTPATGVLNPVGFGSSATELASTDTVMDCNNYSKKIAAKDIWALDCEGILTDKDGNFWICEENGPTIWKLDRNGVVQKRFSPYANQSGAQKEDIMIDSVYKYRKVNRGFEGIAIAPNGKIYAFIQSPLLYPNVTVGESSRIHRILEIDPSTNAMKMYAYVNDGVIGSGGNQIRLKDWKIGDFAAVNDSIFLVIEHAVRGTTDNKKIYMVNINGATAVTSGFVYGGKSLEALTDSTGLAGSGIKPVRKKLFMDLLANGWPSALDKPEGLGILNDSTIVVCNDNDFGQVSVPQDGIAVPTSNLCHVFMYRLRGSNKLPNFKSITPTLSNSITGLSSSKSAFIEPTVAGVKTTAILSSGDSIGSYTMCGTPDGMGAFDNGNGTFTVLMNHEFVSGAGIARAHGSQGSFVSKWVIQKSDFKVLSGSDLIKNVMLWDTTSKSYKLYNSSNPSSLTAFGRFCSADLPAVSAFYNAASGLGTQERIFMNGEETNDESRAFAHIVTGINAGTSYELPNLGKAAWENSVASPASGDKTVVCLMNDGTDGQVYVYVGTKTNTGSEIEKAGLTKGKPYGIKVSGFAAERTSSSSNIALPAAGTRFSMVSLGDVTNMTGAAFNTASNNAGVTKFSRPEDGAWDPANPNDFYFNTTDQLDQVKDGTGSQVGRTRVWRLRFDDVTKPELGGTIEAVVDGTEGANMLDNMTIDGSGHMLLCEDVGNAAHNGKVWQYNIATDKMTIIARHDGVFGDIGLPATAPFNADEETSGVLDVQQILGPGMFLIVDQAHYAQPGQLVEGGQLIALFNPESFIRGSGGGPSTTQTPYLEPLGTGVKVSAIITANDTVGGGYRMAGTPDGTGVFDNGNGTFTMLVNHEFVRTTGSVRAHGSIGSLVSKWVINKNTLNVESGSDLIRNVMLWDTTTKSYKMFNSANPTPMAAFGRFCSADLPAVSAFYNASTGLGTQERIFMNGEETDDESRAFAHIVTGPNGGTSWELPYLGKAAWENSVASPNSGDKTVVCLMNDGTDGQVYVYVGTKTNKGTEIEKAGLTKGTSYGISVTGFAAERTSSSSNIALPTAGTRFSLVSLGDVSNMTGAAFNTASNTAGVTKFSRPEDGAWDPAHPNDFYFVTTDQLDQVKDAVGSQVGRTRLWRLRFDDVTKPEQGGTIEAVLDGSEGPNMLDNITVDHYGHILMCEDVGNAAHNGKVWQYTIATDKLDLIARHDKARFGDIGLAATAPFNIDEETSGVLDAQEVLGPGMFLIVDQAHYALSNPIVEGGQILTLYNPDSYNSNPEINLTGNSVNIPSGTAPAVSTNNTDFGTVDAGNTVSKTFIIQNTGIGSLTINGISFSGTNASEFTLTGAPVFPLTIAPNATQNISVQFKPLAPGQRTAVINIMNNDFDESAYKFNLAGTAIAPEINIQGNNINIINGDQTPGVSNNTDFGTVKIGATATKSFTIQNTGQGDLNVTGITFTGTNASEFTLQGAPVFPWNIAASGSQSFTVQFAPLAKGNRTATVNIASNDLDESAYTFALAGNANTTGIPEVKEVNPVTVFPNPFDASAELKLTLPTGANVNIQVYNTLGELVETVVNGNIEAGTYNYEIGNGQAYAAGVYTIKIMVDNKLYVARVVKQ